MSINLVKLASKCFQCNVFIFRNKRRTVYKYRELKLFNGVILYGASKVPEVYLEPSQTSTYEGDFLQK